MLSTRLKVIFDLIKTNSKVADIGSDHAYLSIKLAEEKKCIVYPVENKLSPFELSLENSKKSSKSENIHCLLSDGLKDVPNDLNYIIIAGMGGKLIQKILLAGKEKLLNFPNLILQPNKEIFIVRNYLSKNGYAIKEEKIILENQKFYEIIYAEKGNQSLSELDLIFGPILSKEKSEVFIAKWQIERKQKMKLLSKIDSKLPNYQKIEDIVKLIGEVL